MNVYRPHVLILRWFPMFTKREVVPRTCKLYMVIVQYKEYSVHCMHTRYVSCTTCNINLYIVQVHVYALCLQNIFIFLSHFMHYSKVWHHFYWEDILQNWKIYKFFLKMQTSLGKHSHRTKNNSLYVKDLKFQYCYSWTFLHSRVLFFWSVTFDLNIFFFFYIT